MPEIEAASRSLTHAEIRRCRTWLARPRTLHSCWSVGRTLDAAQGRHRAEFGRGTMRGYAKQLRTDEDILRHLLRLARCMTLHEVNAAAHAGLGFRSMQFLLVLDSHGKSELRRRLVAAFIRGRIDRSELFRRVRTAKATGPDRLKEGKRLRALLDLRRSVSGQLKRADARLAVDMRLWPTAQRPQVRRLCKDLREIQKALAQCYLDAAKKLRER